MTVFSNTSFRPGRRGAIPSRVMLFGGVGLAVILTALCRYLFLGHFQHGLLNHLPEGQFGAVQVVDWYCTRMLPMENGDAVQLRPEEEDAGDAFLVVELRVSPAAASLRESTNAAGSTWEIVSGHRWFQIVGPGQPLQPSQGVRRENGTFVITRTWSKPCHNNSDPISATVYFRVDAAIAETGRLGLLYRWKRPIAVDLSLQGPSAPESGG